MRVVDLTQPVHAGTAVWPGSPSPSFRTQSSHDGDGVFSRTVAMSEHTGTHIDAPAHFVSGADTTDAITADRLVRPLVVLDVTARCRDDPDYAVTAEDVVLEVAERGPIPGGSIVAARTGWDSRLPDPGRYLPDPPRFPGFSVAAAEALVRRWAVEALAIDAPGIDPGHDEQFSVHRSATLPAGVWHIEGLVNLGHVPARGALIVVGALPLAGGSGAPARVLALVPD